MKGAHRENIYAEEKGVRRKVYLCVQKDSLAVHRCRRGVIVGYLQRVEYNICRIRQRMRFMNEKWKGLLCCGIKGGEYICKAIFVALKH